MEISKENLIEIFMGNFMGIRIRNFMGFFGDFLLEFL